MRYKAFKKTYSEDLKSGHFVFNVVLVITSLVLVFHRLWVAYTLTTFNLNITVITKLLILIIGIILAGASELFYDLKIKKNIKEELKLQYTRFIIFKTFKYLLLITLCYLLMIYIVLKNLRIW